MGGILAVLVGLLAVGTLDTLVWLPMATAPGYSLDEISAALERSDDRSRSVGFALGWVGFWSTAALVYAGLTLPLVPGLLRPLRLFGARRVLGLGFLLLSATSLFHWLSSFSMGNSVSDELPPYGGTITPIGIGFFVVFPVLLFAGLGALFAERPPPEAG